MEPLPKGVTGFEAPDSGVPVKRFTAACHSAAQQVRGHVEFVRAAAGHVTPNFHEASVSWNDGAGKARVLCNAHHPIVAFASPVTGEGDTRIEFVDCPELASAFDAGFHILNHKEASAAISPEALVQLSEAELVQMRYWDPRTIGDLVFNFWD